MHAAAGAAEGDDKLFSFVELNGARARARAWGASLRSVL